MHLRRVRARRRRRAGAAARRAPRGAQQKPPGRPAVQSAAAGAGPGRPGGRRRARDDRGHGDAGAQERAGPRRPRDAVWRTARRRTHPPRAVDAPLAPSRRPLENCTTQVAHPYADALLEDVRFDLWRVNPSEIFYVGGFGVGTTWVEKDDYTEAKPDAVAHEAVGQLHGAENELEIDMVAAMASS